MKNIFALLLTVIFVSCHDAHAINIKSEDIASHSILSNKYVFNGFGCEGEDISPQLSWSAIPEGTKSFAITVYDPDAPTGSGWWHWVLVNIPASYSKIPQGFGKEDKFLLADGIKQIRNDFGIYRFGGSCPPKGDKKHRYFFTIHALKVEKLDLESSATAAMAGYMINQNTIAKKSLLAFYQR